MSKLVHSANIESCTSQYVLSAKLQHRTERVLLWTAESSRSPNQRNTFHPAKFQGPSLFLYMEPDIIQSAGACEYPLRTVRPSECQPTQQHMLSAVNDQRNRLQGWTRMHPKNPRLKWTRKSTSFAWHGEREGRGVIQERQWRCWRRRATNMLVLFFFLRG